MTKETEMRAAKRRGDVREVRRLRELSKVTAVVEQPVEHDSVETSSVTETPPEVDLSALEEEETEPRFIAE